MNGLIERGYDLIHVPYGVLPNLLLRSWGEFMETYTEDERRRFYIPIPPDEEEDEGYANLSGKKKPDGRISDPKFFLHWRPNLISRLKEVSGLTDDVVMRHQEFLGLSRELYYICLRSCENKAQRIDAEMGTNILAGIREASRLNLHALRLLYYIKNSTGLEPAKEHLDRDFLTIQVAETNPGFYFVDSFGNRIPYESRPGQNLIFAGRKAQEACGILPLPHGVQEITVLINGCIRMSIVFFCHTPHIL